MTVEKSVASSASTRYGRTVLGLLFTINLLNYVDRLAVSGLLEPIRKDLNLTDAQLGRIALAFLIPYSILPPVVGWIGDRSNRSRLIAWAIALWSAATAITGVTRSFGQLAATRAVVGVGEATYMTVAPSMVSDVYGSGTRGRAMSFFYTASPVGSALGVILAGLFASAYNWRVACMMVALPGIVMTLVMSFFPEPKRGALDAEQQAERPPLREAARSLMRNRPFLWLTLAYTVQVFAYNPVEFWLPTVLQRDKGIPLVQANTIYGVLVFVAGFLGPLLGGFFADMLIRRRRTVYYWICVASALGSVLPIVGFVFLGRGVPLFSAVFVEVFLGNVSTGLVFAILMTIVIPGLRGTATAIILTVMHLLGDGLSQPLIGQISSALQSGGSSLLGPGGKFPMLAQMARDQHLTLALACVAAPSMFLSAWLFFLAIPRAPASTIGDGYAEGDPSVRDGSVMHVQLVGKTQ
jgi:MFS family permease